MTPNYQNWLKLRTDYAIFPLSPTLFNIHLDEVVTTRQEKTWKEFHIKKSAAGNTVIYWWPSYHVQHGLTVSAEKTKLGIFKGWEPVSSKTVTDKKF